MRILEEPKIEGPKEEKTIIEQALINNPQYSNPRYFLDPSTSEGPRACFIYDWGYNDIESKNADDKENEKQERILKTDRLHISNERARIHHDNGCTTLNDVKALTKLGPESFRHHISPVLDFWWVEYKGKMHTVSAEKFFRGYRSLHSLMPQLKKEPLIKEEFDIISANAIDALEFTDQNDIYHRDFSLRNIITNIRTKKQDTVENSEIRKYFSKAKKFFGFNTQNTEGLEAIVTDYANSCLKSHPQIKPQQTMGARQIGDPLMLIQEKAYDNMTEIYAVAKDFLEMLVGEQLLEVDQINKKARILKTRFTEEQDLYDENGRFKYGAYTEAIDGAIFHNLPSFARKYDSVLRKALFPEEWMRYKDTKEFIKDWKKISKKDSFTRVKRIAQVGAAALALGAISYTALSIHQKEIDALETKANTYIIHAEYNSETQNITNNYVDLEVDLSPPGRPLLRNPQYFSLKKGETVWPHISALYGAVSEKYRAGGKLEGNVRFEGTHGRDFEVYPKKPGYVEEHPNMIFTALGQMMEVPKEVPEGSVINLIAELYAPESGRYYYLNPEKINFDSPGKVISRINIPVYVTPKNGRPNLSNIIKLQNLKLDGRNGSELEMTRADSAQATPNIDPSLNYMVWVPEQNCITLDTTGRNGYCGIKPLRVELPKGETTSTNTMIVVALRGNVPIYSTAVPIKRSNPYACRDDGMGSMTFKGNIPTYSDDDSTKIKRAKELTQFSTWDVTLPDKQFNEQSIKYLQQGRDLAKQIIR